MSSVEENKKGLSSKQKGVIIALSIVIGLLFIAFLVIRIYYSNRWYANTWIAGHEVSNMTLEETEQLLKDVYDNYKLTITGRSDGIQTIAKDDIRYEVDLTDSLHQQFGVQHEHFRVFQLPKRKEIGLDLKATYDEKELKKLLEQSALCQGSDTYDIIEPENAKVVFSKEQQCFVVKSEINGNTLDTKAFVSAVQNVLNNGFETLDLRDSKANPDVYKKPEILKDNETLLKQVDESNRVALRWFVWKIDSKQKKVITPSQICKWYTYQDGKMKLNTKAVQKWVEKYCLSFKTMGMKRTFTNHAGKEITVSGGDYGWAFDYEAMLKQLTNALNKTINPELQTAYRNDPSEKNKKALTITKKPKFIGTGFQYDSENKMNDWDQENFTEISLSDQKVYVWRKGKVVFKCKTISGRPVPGRETRKGAYYIKEHQPYRVLKGDDYETPVNNWVRIMWTGTGFHAAPWQSWRSWTKNYYKVRGSHGCLNLSVEDSQKIYKLTKYKEMVFIY